MFDDFRYETVLDHLPDGVYLVDRAGTILYWNHGAERISGWARDEVVGRVCTPAMLAHHDAGGAPLLDGKSPLEECLASGAAWESEAYIRRRDGALAPVYTRVAPVRNAIGEAIGALEVFSDNSSRVQAMQRIKELEELALLDPVTGVGNRRYAEMSLHNGIEESRRYGWPFGVLFADIDRFKRINDTFGHPVGDEVLRMVAHGLKSCLRKFDFVGRWGGEEFAVLLPNISDDVLERVAERCRRLVEESTFQCGGRIVEVTVSIGGTLARQGEPIETCIDRADRLLYASKQAGRNRVHIEG